MNTTIRKIGNSEGIIIPKDVLEEMQLAAGDNVVLVRDGDAEEFERKMKIARKRMKKYEIALRELAR